MVVETIIETPNGMRLGAYCSTHTLIEAAVQNMRDWLSTGTHVSFQNDDGYTLIPNDLLRRSVIKFRDASNDKDVPF